MVQQFGGDKKRWGTAMFGRNFMDALQGRSRLLPGEPKSFIDHEGTGERMTHTFAVKDVVQVVHFESSSQ
jgi:hypothetical protein